MQPYKLVVTRPLATYFWRRSDPARSMDRSGDRRSNPVTYFVRSIDPVTYLYHWTDQAELLDQSSDYAANDCKHVRVIMLSCSDGFKPFPI